MVACLSVLTIEGSLVSQYVATDVVVPAGMRASVSSTSALNSGSLTSRSWLR